MDINSSTNSYYNMIERSPENNSFILDLSDENIMFNNDSDNSPLINDNSRASSAMNSKINSFVMADKIYDKENTSRNIIFEENKNYINEAIIKNYVEAIKIQKDFKNNNIVKKNKNSPKIPKYQNSSSKSYENTNYEYEFLKIKKEYDNLKKDYDYLEKMNDQKHKYQTEYIKDLKEDIQNNVNVNLKFQKIFDHNQSSLKYDYLNFQMNVRTNNKIQINFKKSGYEYSNSERLVLKNSSLYFDKETISSSNFNYVKFKKYDKDNHNSDYEDLYILDNASEYNNSNNNLIQFIDYRNHYYKDNFEEKGNDCMCNNN